MKNEKASIKNYLNDHLPSVRRRLELFNTGRHETSILTRSSVPLRTEVSFVHAGKVDCVQQHQIQQAKQHKKWEKNN